jgi:ABC-type transporter Mla MlaB component
MAASPPSMITFAIWGPIARGDLPGLCDRVCTLIAASGAATAICDVAGVSVDAVTVDALARLQLLAGRQNCRIRLRNPSGELRELVEFMGLADVFAP